MVAALLSGRFGQLLRVVLPDGLCAYLSFPFSPSRVPIGGVDKPSRQGQPWRSSALERRSSRAVGCLYDTGNPMRSPFGISERQRIEFSGSDLSTGWRIYAD